MATAEPDPAGALAAEDVSKTYGGGHMALHRVSLAVPRGVATAILGPNGAGKTTLIKLLLGLITATRGHVSVMGEAPRAAVARGRVGAMLQETTLPSLVTVSELIHYLGSLYPRPLSVGQCLAEAGIADLGARRVERLSGGQRRRVAFAAAIVGRPAVVFLDEPTEGMDIEARQGFWDRLAEFRRDEATTVLFSTHDLAEADRYADRVVLLAQGHVVADDTPAALKAQLGRRRVSFQAPAASTPADLSAALGVEVTAGAQPGHFHAWTPDTDRVIRRLAGDSRCHDFQIVSDGLDAVFRSLVRDTESGGKEAGA